MRAIVYKGQNKVAVEEVDDPKIEHPRGAIIKLTSTGICVNCVRGFPSACLTVNPKLARWSFRICKNWPL